MENETTKPYKLGSLVNGREWRPCEYPNVWARETTTGPQRIVAAPRNGYVDLLIELSRTLPEPFGILYVLLVPRRGHDAGRYQSPVPLSRMELEGFLDTYRAFLEKDGRHHLWITSLPDNSSLIYDQHNVIYGYGPLDSFEAILRARGMQEGEVRFPTPHSHNYNAEFDDDEDAILAHWEWQRHPLVPGTDER